MTEIYSISSGFLISYMESKDKDGLDMEKIFKRLSFEMGGDGKSITKNQLSDYIKNAESGLIAVDSAKLKALKTILNNWDTISNGSDSITYEDIKKYSALLAATMDGEFTKTEIKDKTPSLKNEILDYLKNYYKLGSKSEISQPHLEKFLSDLLAQKGQSTNANSDIESDLIDTVTNMLASSAKTSTIEKEV